MVAAVPLAAAGLLGLLVGSFLNVVIHRLPRQESLARPASHCPSCATPIRFYDNVPVVSRLLLRGRCRACRAPIAARYPLVEGATALLCAGAVWAVGADRDAWSAIALVLLLVPVTLIDLEHRIIPNTLLAPAAVLAVGLLAALSPDRLPEHLIAAAAAGGFLLVAALAYPGGMGMGDVKLAAVLGLFLGRAAAPAIMVALIAGAVAGGAIIARKGVQAGRKTAVPFGPFLALGGLAGLLAGDAVVDWYLATFF